MNTDGKMMRLQITGLVKNYNEKQVLRGADYVFEEGNIYGILGRNGAGKTTLFNCMTKDIPYEGGRIEVIEDGVSRPVAFDDIGLVSASPMLPEFLTGYEFVHFFYEAEQRGSAAGELHDRGIF
ncbi:MAG: ATP-binding cassette domain-containing protein [Lachnospiraceae bacterium]